MLPRDFRQRRDEAIEARAAEMGMPTWFYRLGCRVLQWLAESNDAPLEYVESLPLPPRYFILERGTGWVRVRLAHEGSFQIEGDRWLVAVWDDWAARGGDPLQLPLPAGYRLRPGLGAWAHLVTNGRGFELRDVHYCFALAIAWRAAHVDHVLRQIGWCYLAFVIGLSVAALLGLP